MYVRVKQRIKWNIRKDYNEFCILDCNINISPYWVFVYVSLGLSFAGRPGGDYIMGRELNVAGNVHRHVCMEDPRPRQQT